jgi:hypothetical protein
MQKHSRLTVINGGIIMNERIKELAEQATSIVDMVGPQGYTSSYANFDREKFAELIIQECADIGERYADGNYEIRNQILIHFGLEEPEE